MREKGVYSPGKTTGGGCLKKSFIKKFVSIILILLIAVSSLFTVSAAEIRKNSKKYDIAVVFDNSGSMYTTSSDKNNTRWCRAKYSMEIFASMLDYTNGDKLTIYTMWPVSVTGESGRTTYEIEIRNEKDIEKINKMYTVYDKYMSTPYAPVEEAISYLKNGSDGFEKWLIVLTDGDFNYEDRGQLAEFDKGKDIKARLNDVTRLGIKVQFLGLDLITSKGSQNTTSKISENFYWTDSTGNALKDNLIHICNMIFKRNELDSGYLKGNKLTFDMSMSKIIVFVQGNQNKSPVLKKSSGEIIDDIMNSGLRHYSEIRANEYPEAPVDTSLYGQVVTYDNLSKGEYILEYPGSQNEVKIFYEPDVDISVKMLNSDDQVVDPESKEIYPGTYTVEYSVIDSLTGEDVTKSPLMGPNGVSELNCVAEIQNGDKTTEKKVENKGTLELAEGDKVFFNISGKYLEDYTITSSDNKEGFTFTISAHPEASALTVDVQIEQDGEWYHTKKRDEWEPIKVSVGYDGNPLTDEQMSTVTPVFEFSPEVDYTYEMIPGESAYAVYIGVDKNGNETEVETGSYKIKASASFVDEYGRTIQTDKSDSGKFEVQGYSKWIKILLIILGILILALIIFFIMSRKVLPKDLIAERREFKLKGRNAGNGKYSYDRRGKTLQLASPPVPTDMDAECRITLSLYPVDRRWTPSRRRKVGIRDINGASMGVVRVRIDGTAYEKKDGRFCQKLAPEDPIKEESTSPSIRIETKKSIYDCSFTSN